MNINGMGAPTKSTFGTIGDYYIDTTTDTMYKLVDINNIDLNYQFIEVDSVDPEKIEYVWEVCGGKTSGGFDAVIKVDHNDENEPVITLLSGDYKSISDKLYNGELVNVAVYRLCYSGIELVHIEKIQHQYEGTDNVNISLVVLNSGNAESYDIHPDNTVTYFLYED